MSTAIILTNKSPIAEKFNLGVSNFRKIETDKRFDLKYEDIIKINPDLCPIPITTPNEYKVLTKIYSQKKYIRLGSISKCLTGEADMTFAKKAMSKNKNDALLIKGVQIDRYEIKYSPAEISQGEIEFLNVELFEKIYKGKKIKDAYQKRIILQGLTGVNERFRLKATVIDPPVFLANSCNYLLDRSEVPFNVLLGLLNSRLLNFIFKCNSTSSNVNGYEVDNLPIPESLEETEEKEIGNLVGLILTEKKKNPQADTSELESQIDRMLYDLYGLTEKEIAIVEGKDKQ